MLGHPSIVEGIKLKGGISRIIHGLLTWDENGGATGMTRLLEGGWPRMRRTVRKASARR
jgi:hypothetical protein